MECGMEWSGREWKHVPLIKKISILTYAYNDIHKDQWKDYRSVFDQ